MPYAERITPTSRAANHKLTTLPMPVAAFHNDEERRISSLYSFVRRKCVEYFADEESDGRIGLRCAFCRDASPSERDPRSRVFPLQTVSIHAAAITLLYAHLPRCSEVPDAVLEHLEVLRERDLAADAAAGRPRKRYRWSGVAEEMGFRDTDAGIRFIPPETSGRKRQATAIAASASSASARAREERLLDPTPASASAGSSRTSSPTPPPRADWTDEDDLRLWKGQEKLGNRWKEVSEQVFHNAFRGDQVRNRWYSAAFQEAVAKRFGEGAYAKAQAGGRQAHNGGHGGAAPSVAWTDAEDARLWEAQRELGNRWKDISARMGRSNSDHVKTRWYSDKFKEFVAREHGSDAYRAAHVQGKQERQGARPQVEWSEADDRLLWASGLDHTGNRNWEEISIRRFDGRMSDNHLKNRWYSAAFKRFVAREFGPDAYQNAKIGRRGAQSQVDWTREDDRILWESHAEMGNKWAVIAETRFAGRISENQVKNRWYSAPFKKFVAEEVGPDAHRNAKHRK